METSSANFENIHDYTPGIYRVIACLVEMCVLKKKKKKFDMLRPTQFKSKHISVCLQIPIRGAFPKSNYGPKFRRYQQRSIELVIIQ